MLLVNDCSGAGCAPSFTAFSLIKPFQEQRKGGIVTRLIIRIGIVFNQLLTCAQVTL